MTTEPATPLTNAYGTVYDYQTLKEWNAHVSRLTSPDALKKARYDIDEGGSLFRSVHPFTYGAGFDKERMAMFGHLKRHAASLGLIWQYAGKNSWYRPMTDTEQLVSGVAMQFTPNRPDGHPKP